MASFTTQEIERATVGTWLQPLAQEATFTSVDTDTRQIQAGSLFVAFKGETFDGHAFVLDAIQKGAAGAVVSDVRDEFRTAGVPIYVVANTLTAYQELARFHRRRFQIPVVAVTGSVGKTTTRNMIATVLSQKLKVLQTEKNFNNEIGLPKTLLQLTPAHEACVVEMGMRGLGQIAALAAIAEPTIGVVTNVGKSHIELLGSQENIAKAKCELVRALDEQGIAILNQDDPFVAAMADCCRGKVVGYSVKENAPVWADRISASEKGIHFTCHSFDQVFELTVPVIGLHNVYNALAAVAVGRVLGVREHAVKKGLAEYRGVPMREEIIRLGAYTFINDAYNANPASMGEAVRTLANLTKGRKIAVLGGMLELGDWAPREHQAIGRAVAAAGIDVLITLGELGQYIAEAAQGAGMKDVYTVTDHAGAAQVLQSLLRPGDTVLLKASRGFAMEKILPYFERK